MPTWMFVIRHHSRNQMTQITKSWTFYSIYFCGNKILVSSPQSQSLLFQNVSFRYSEDTPWIYKNLEFGLDLDTRLALVGPNGAGKSTLLKLIFGEVIKRKKKKNLIWNCQTFQICMLAHALHDIRPIPGKIWWNMLTHDMHNIVESYYTVQVKDQP